MSTVTDETPKQFGCPGCGRPVKLVLVNPKYADWFHEDGTKRCEWRYTP